MEEVKKKKKAYVKPEMHVEEFTPNEYIAACWYIACDYGIQGGDSKNGYIPQEGGGGHTMRSGGSGCGWAKNQVIKGDLENFKFVEENSGYGKPLDCTITGQSDSPLKEGSTITWETCNYYKHKGTVHLKNQTRPLHS